MNFNSLTTNNNYQSSSDYDFEKGDELSDLKLIVENKIFYVHKAILGNASPVFKKMITTDFKEKKEGEINLPDKKIEDIMEMLFIIYPHKVKDIDGDKCEALLALSEEYDIFKIRILSENVLIKKVDDYLTTKKKLYGKEIDKELDEIMNLLKLADFYRLKRLKTACISYLTKKINQNSIEKHQYYSEMDYNDRLGILKAKLTLSDEKVLNKDGRIKELEDENLKQKFEIRSLKLNIESNNTQNSTQT